MDDFSSAIEQLKGMLSSDTGQNQLKNMIGMLSGQGSRAEEQDAPPAGSSEREHNAGTDMFAKIGGAMSSMGIGENRNAAFLTALKPFLGESRRGRLDNAVQMMKVARIASMFKGNEE